MQEPSKVIPMDRARAQETALAREAALGDQQAFAQLVRANEGALYRIAWAMLGSDADSCDAVQDAILRAWVSLPGLREPQWFRTWLIRILINECRQMLRRRKRTAPMPDAELGGPSGFSDEALDVRRAIRLLPEDQRMVTVLFYFDDFSVEMIARSLQMAEGTVKSRLHAARAKLKRILEVDEP